NSEFAGGDLACWRGAGDEHTRCGLGGVSNEASKPKSPSPEGRGGVGPSASLLVGHSPTVGDAPFSRLASGPTALPPKSEVIFERTLTRQDYTLRRKFRRVMYVLSVGIARASRAVFGALAEHAVRSAGRGV